MTARQKEKISTCFRACLSGALITSLVSLLSEMPIASADDAIEAQAMFGHDAYVEFSSYPYEYPPTPFTLKRAKKLGIEPKIETEPAIPLSGYLFKPSDEGPHSAVVLLHTCAGMSEHEGHWVKTLLDWGHVVLAVDSLSPRDLHYICDGRKGSIGPWNRALDAFGAKAYLSTLPFVDPDRIAVMGMSHGGMAVLETIKKSTTENIPEKPFSAAIVYYPLCGEAAPLNAPGLILIGELDAWTPSNQCIQLFDQHRK